MVFKMLNELNSKMIVGVYVQGFIAATAYAELCTTQDNLSQWLRIIDTQITSMLTKN